VFFDGPAPEPPERLAAAVRRQSKHWELEWHGPLGDVLEAIRGFPVGDVEIEPFKLEDYVLTVYSARSGPPS
jgi:hypothetical protein